MSFTDQKPRITTLEDLHAPWEGYPDGSHFYCKLCGYSFMEGDTWRWVFVGERSLPNLLVCQGCDGEDILEKWAAWWAEWESLKIGKLRYIATRLRDAESHVV